MIKKYLKLIFCIAICEGAGIIGAVYMMPEIDFWYNNLDKPSINPPNWVFGPVWAILFFLMGISLFLAWQKKWKADVLAIGMPEKKSWNPLSAKLWFGSWQEENAIIIFALQLILNVWWPVIFFGMRNPGLAFFELLALWFAILYTIVNFYRISKAAAYLLLPYILWVSFAGVLNFLIWFLN